MSAEAPPVAAPTKRSLAELPRRRPNRDAAMAVRGHYDAAGSDRFSSVHFNSATITDAAAAMRPTVQTLRNRCRHEFQNNGYARGITDTHGNDVVGSGPRLQMQTPDADLNDRIEDAWSEFAGNYIDASGQLDLAAILRAVDSAQFHTGAALLVIAVDKAADTPVALRLQIVEVDRLETPLKYLTDENVRDGIRFDKSGKPKTYYILKRHPGDFSATGQAHSDYDEVAAAQVIHVFRTDRPGQTTAVPWLTPALTPLAALRDFTRAVLRAAHRAASISGVFQTNSADVEPDESIEAMEEIDLPDDAALTLPVGWSFQGFQPTQPTATYGDFKNEILREIGRAVCMPFNIVAGHSGGYNYASGRLDWQIYFRHIKTIQAWYGRLILDAILRVFLSELPTLSWFQRKWWALTNRYPAHAWFWPGHTHVDPVKEAAAQALRFANNTTTLADEWAAMGEDWARKLAQIAKEKRLIADLEAKYKIKMTTADILPAGSILAATLVDEPAAAPTGGKANAA